MFWQLVPQWNGQGIHPLELVDDLCNVGLFIEVLRQKTLGARDKVAGELLLGNRRPRWRRARKGALEQQEVKGTRCCADTITLGDFYADGLVQILYNVTPVDA